jgi:hypothetical protein
MFLCVHFIDSPEKRQVTEKGRLSLRLDHPKNENLCMTDGKKQQAME